MSNFQALIELQQSKGYLYKEGSVKAFFAPDLGARVFCELNGLLLHRLDIDNVKKNDRSFNNYGGNNFWPAPEGGTFGFNYDGDQWHVQPAINNKPFVLKQALSSSATAQKQITLVNRKGAAIDIRMQRIFSPAPVSKIVSLAGPSHEFAYVVEDSIDVLSKLRTEDGLISCWTLEQFDASMATTAFVVVDSPHKAINFDFYEHPAERIEYKSKGFFYKTDSQKAGQIGIKASASARCIGFFDLARNIVCIREIIGFSGGTYFNIADNAQPNGPFSAADNYSIFNGGHAQGFFELETIGAAEIQNNIVASSRLVSKTSLALFESDSQIEQLVHMLIGS